MLPGWRWQPMGMCWSCASLGDSNWYLGLWWNAKCLVCSVWPALSLGKKGGLLQEERIFWYWLVDNENTEHQSWNSVCWVLKSLEDIEVPWRGRSQIGRSTGYAWLIFCRLQSFPLWFAGFPCLAASFNSSEHSVCVHGLGGYRCEPC